MIPIPRAKVSVQEKAAEQLSSDSIARQVLESAAKRLEDLHGSSSYKQAWRIASRALRAMKPD